MKRKNGRLLGNVLMGLGLVVLIGRRGVFNPQQLPSLIC